MGRRHRRPRSQPESYDGYLSAYAEAVRAYRHPVILSFGHEMNGIWSPWGYRHTSPEAFVAAWRHIVNAFPCAGCPERDLAVDSQHHQRLRAAAKSPTPESVVARQLVCDLGRDRRLLPQAVTGSSLPCSGRPSARVRTLTNAPILIAETGAMPAADQPSKIADLFAGIHAMGCSGSSGSTPRTPSDSPSASTAQPPSPHSARAPAPSLGLDHERPASEGNDAQQRSQEAVQLWLTFGARGTNSWVLRHDTGEPLEPHSQP